MAEYTQSHWSATPEFFSRHAARSILRFSSPVGNFLRRRHEHFHKAKSSGQGAYRTGDLAQLVERVLSVHKVTCSTHVVSIFFSFHTPEG